MHVHVCLYTCASGCVAGSEKSQLPLHTMGFTSYINPLTHHISITMHESHLSAFTEACFSALLDDNEYLIGLQMALLALDKQLSR